MLEKIAKKAYRKVCQNMLMSAGLDPQKITEEQFDHIWELSKAGKEEELQKFYKEILSN